MAAEDMFGFKALELELVQTLNTRTQQLDQAARANLSLLRGEHRATVARLEATVKQKTDEHAIELEGRHEMLGWAVQEITGLKKMIHLLQGFISSKMEGEIAELRQQLAAKSPATSTTGTAPRTPPRTRDASTAVSPRRIRGDSTPVLTDSAAGLSTPVGTPVRAAPSPPMTDPRSPDVATAPSLNVSQELAEGAATAANLQIEADLRAFEDYLGISVPTGSHVSVSVEFKSQAPLVKKRPNP